MRTRGGKTRVAQAWVELRSDDPEAVSALGVARTRLAAGRSLASLRRLRLIEVRGALPARAEIEALLHRSIQFYNPHKERCVVRLETRESAPAATDETLVLVTERGGEERPAAERWWRHQTGAEVEVREGVVWALRFTTVDDPRAAARELTRVEDRHRGLLCNPHAQTMDVADGPVPLPWIHPDTRRDA
ncbi:MAG: hypothetical protein ACHQ52_00665 [Candidatus Eisenbacteria bacterium]